MSGGIIAILPFASYLVLHRGLADFTSDLVSSATGIV
jgi:hypothetical protein